MDGSEEQKKQLEKALEIGQEAIDAFDEVIGRKIESLSTHDVVLVMGVLATKIMVQYHMANHEAFGAAPAHEILQNVLADIAVNIKMSGGEELVFQLIRKTS